MATVEPKIGLALSGGGFRASLFHVGVLARMAELGLLRRVEVISTVSGGSIVGALLYLHLKRLLESTPDDELEDSHYVRLIDRLERDFSDGIQRNIRARIFFNLFKNFRMASSAYSRSDRIGDLFDQILYKPAWSGDRPKRWWGLVDEQIQLRELLIKPAGDEHPRFRPDEHNGPRRAKVPVLLINATSLNTGHNWRFEAVRMGEPAPKDPRTREIVDDVDKNSRLAQGYFEPDPGSKGHRAISTAQRDFPLGLAVAASACVPTLFHPLAISDLYPDLRVELVDGGVHDNQGVQALFDQRCTHLILSDASGQLGDLEQPATRVPGVAGRSIGIYGDRVRDEQLVHASHRAEPVALMHLRKGLRARVVEPLDDEGRPVENLPATEREGDFLATAFNVHGEVQRALARVRTDLDSFSDTEAWALELDGYLMSDLELRTKPGIAELIENSAGAEPQHWRFGEVESFVAAGKEARPDWFESSLTGARNRFGKPLVLSPALRWGLAALTLAAAVAALVSVVVWWGELVRAFSVEWPVWWSLVAAGGVLLFVLAYLKEKGPLPLRALGHVLVSLLVPILAAPFLWLFSLATLGGNRLFLWLGRVRVDNAGVRRVNEASVPNQTARSPAALGSRAPRR